MDPKTDKVGIKTTNLWNRGEYTFTQTVTKVGYASMKGQSTFTNTFKVILIDPCMDTKLSATIANVSITAIIG